MKLPRRSLAISVSTLLLASLTVGAQQASASHARRAVGSATRLSLIHAGILTVGSDTTYPPMESSDLAHPGTYVGTDVDLANALARAMGLKGAKIVSTNFSTIIPTLQRGNFDVIMSSINDTPERRKQIQFVDYMKLRASLAILLPKSSSIKAGSYKGLCGHSVSVQNGTTELDGLNAATKLCVGSKIDIHSYDADTAAFQALASGHVDAYTTDLPVALFYAKSHSNIKFAGRAFGTGGYYGIGLVKRATALHAALQKALSTIVHNGVYRKILNRWGLGSTAINR